MKFISTIFNLFSQVNRYLLSKDESRWRVFFRLLVLYVRSKLSTQKEITCKLNGFTIHAFDYSTLIELYKEIFLEKIYDFKSSTDAPFIIDCGSHIGISVLYFKMIYPDSKIRAFEPNPNSFEMLRRNIAANKLKDVAIFNCALTDFEGIRFFYVPLRKGSLNGALNQISLPSEVIQVKTMKLSHVIRDFKIDFIKIDVEGEESNIIKELMAADILQNVNEFIIEYHHAITTSELNSFISNFERNGFTCLSAIDQVPPMQQDRILHLKRF